MKKGVKIALIVLGCIVGLVLLFLLTLFIMGGQTIDDPFVSGIDVVDVPYTTPSTITWRLVGVPETTKTVLYISKESRPAAEGFAPDALGYTESVDPRTETVDGVKVFKADVPAGDVYVRVYADIDGPKWSQEYFLEAS